MFLFLLSHGTQIDDNKYLSSLENGIELIVYTEEQIQKFSVYFELKRYLGLKTSHIQKLSVQFELKRYLSLKNILYPLDIDYFL